MFMHFNYWISIRSCWDTSPLHLLSLDHSSLGWFLGDFWVLSNVDIILIIQFLFHTVWSYLGGIWSTPPYKLDLLSNIRTSTLYKFIVHHIRLSVIANKIIKVNKILDYTIYQRMCDVNMKALLNYELHSSFYYSTCSILSSVYIIQQFLCYKFVASTLPNWDWQIGKNHVSSYAS